MSCSRRSVRAASRSQFATAPPHTRGAQLRWVGECSAAHFTRRVLLTRRAVFVVVRHRVRLGVDEATGEKVALKCLKKKEMGITADVIRQVVRTRV
jgi:hypothetical protein